MAKNKITLNQFIWSQVNRLPNDGRFFYITLNDTFSMFTWYENGNMRGSSGPEGLSLNHSLSFSSNEKKIRGEVMTAGSYMELIIEGLVYINTGVYNAEKAIKRKSIDKIISDKVDRRAEWLSIQGVIMIDTVGLIKKFSTFRNKIAHSYTFKDLEYEGLVIENGNWPQISKRIERDYEKVISDLLKAYHETQTPIIEYMFNVVKNEQVKSTIPLVVPGFWKELISVEQFDVRDISDWNERIIIDFDSTFRSS